MEKRGQVENISLERGVWVEEREEVLVVVIKNPQDHHLGSFICSATNKLGEDHQVIKLKGKSSEFLLHACRILLNRRREVFFALKFCQ